MNSESIRPIQEQRKNSNEKPRHQNKQQQQRQMSELPTKQNKRQSKQSQSPELLSNKKQLIQNNKQLEQLSQNSQLLQQNIQLPQQSTTLGQQSLKRAKWNQKWQQIIKKEEQQGNDEEDPFLLTEESFKSNNDNFGEQYVHQKNMMQEAAAKGKQLLINKQYNSASKQLSKSVMAFEFIMKNHVQRIGKQQIKNLMITTVMPTYNNLALCYLKLQNYQLALSFTNQVLGQDPDNIKARYRRAVAHRQLKHTDEAIKDFQIIKKVDPEMETNCNDNIRQCKQIQIAERKKRKITARKFLSGYQSQDIKVAASQDNANSVNSQIIKIIKTGLKASLQKKCQSLITWTKEKCQGCSKILSKFKAKKSQTMKQQ